MITLRYFLAQQLGKIIELISPYTIVSTPRKFTRNGRQFDEFGNEFTCKG